MKFEKVRTDGVNDVASCPYCCRVLDSVQGFDIEGGYLVFCSHCNKAFQLSQTDEGVDIYANKDWIK